MRISDSEGSHSEYLHMATHKPQESEALPPEDRPRPGSLGTEGETVRDVGKRGYEDARGPKKDTDQSGFDTQRDKAPATAPTRRLEKTGGADDR